MQPNYFFHVRVKELIEYLEKLFGYLEKNLDIPKTDKLSGETI